MHIIIWWSVSRPFFYCFLYSRHTIFCFFLGNKQSMSFHLNSTTIFKTNKMHTSAYSYNRTLSHLSIPVQFEPAVRSLRATIPEAQSHRYCHQKHYSTVLLTWASTAYVFMAKRQSCPGGHVCLGIEAYHMPTHVKSLSRHNISDGSLWPEQWL